MPEVNVTTPKKKRKFNDIEQSTPGLSEQLNKLTISYSLRRVVEKFANAKQCWLLVSNVPTQEFRQSLDILPQDIKKVIEGALFGSNGVYYFLTARDYTKSTVFTPHLAHIITYEHLTDTKFGGKSHLIKAQGTHNAFKSILLQTSKHLRKTIFRAVHDASKKIKLSEILKRDFAAYLDLIRDQKFRELFAVEDLYTIDSIARIYGYLDAQCECLQEALAFCNTPVMSENLSKDIVSSPVLRFHPKEQPETPMAPSSDMKAEIKRSGKISSGKRLKFDA